MKPLAFTTSHPFYHYNDAECPDCGVKMEGELISIELGTEQPYIYGCVCPNCHTQITVGVKYHRLADDEPEDPEAVPFYLH